MASSELPAGTAMASAAVVGGNGGDGEQQKRRKKGGFRTMPFILGE